MAHRTSYPALHAARIILESYSIEVRPPETIPSGALPNLQANEAHLSVLIDYASQVFEVALMRPEMRYWQNRLKDGSAEAPQIATFVRKVIEALLKVPKELPNRDAPRVGLNGFASQQTGVIPFKSAWAQLTISEAALLAMRLVFYHFKVSPLTPPLMPIEDAHLRLAVAKLIDASLGLKKAMLSLPILRKCEADLKGGKATAGDVARCLREVGVLLEYLPNYADREDEVKLLV